MCPGYYFDRWNPPDTYYDDTDDETCPQEDEGDWLYDEHKDDKDNPMGGVVR